MVSERRVMLHPGVIVKDALIDSNGFTLVQAAKALRLSKKTLALLFTGKIKLTWRMAEKLGNYFKNDPRCWYNLQTDYDEWLDSRSS